MAKKRRWEELPLGQVHAGTSLRDGDGAPPLDHLAQSLKDHGMLQPLLVRSDGDGGYVCVVGSRRLAAAQLAGLRTVSCFVIEDEPTEADVLVQQLVENLQRADLRPIEQARAYQELQRVWQCSQREVAKRLCIDHATVSRALDLLTLQPEVRELVDKGELSARAALTTRDDPPEAQVEQAREMARAGTTGAQAQARRKAPPAKKTWDLATPGRWRVQVTATRKRASEGELLAELAGLVDELRGREATGPRLAA